MNKTVNSSTIHHQWQWDQLFRHLKAVPLTDQHGNLKPLTVTWEHKKKKRGLSQNALSHVWYAQVSRTEHEYTPDQIKRRCKLYFGVPILRADDPEFNQFCLAAIDPMFTDEERVKAMRYVAVTSVMKTDQMKEYMDAVQRHYAGRVLLEYPNEEQK